MRICESCLLAGGQAHTRAWAGGQAVGQGRIGMQSLARDTPVHKVGTQCAAYAAVRELDEPFIGLDNE